MDTRTCPRQGRCTRGTSCLWWSTSRTRCSCHTTPPPCQAIGCSRGCLNKNIQKDLSFVIINDNFIVLLILLCFIRWFGFNFMTIILCWKRKKTTLKPLDIYLLDNTISISEEKSKYLIKLLMVTSYNIDFSKTLMSKCVRNKNTK